MTRLETYQNARAICIELDGIDDFHCTWYQHFGAFHELTVKSVVDYYLSVCAARTENIAFL